MLVFSFIFKLFNFFIFYFFLNSAFSSIFKRFYLLFLFSGVFNHISMLDPMLKMLSPRGVGQTVIECVVKALCDVKVTGLKPARTKNLAMLRVHVAQVGCDPR